MSACHALTKVTILLLLGASGTATAETAAPPLPAEELEEYQQLLGLLEEQTTIATRTRLNADYVPGMVSVLHGEEMEAGGSRTVWEALAKVPGVELSVEESGRKQVVVRGLGRTYASGTVKILLNGVAMNSAQTAHASPVLNIPIEQVERIEVIRGPGSAVYGEFAFTGVINVITRSDERKLFLRAAEADHRGGGGIYSYRAPDDDLSIDLNIGHWREDGGGVYVEEDILYVSGDEAFSNAPGRTNEAQRNTTALLSLQRSGYRFKLQSLEDGFGDHFGINEELPPDEQRTVTRNRYQGLELGKRYAISEHLSTDIHASLLRTEEEKERQFVSNTERYTDFGCPPPCVMNRDYAEQRNSAGIDINWEPDEQHRLLFTLGYSHIRVKQSSDEWGLDGGTMTAFDPVITSGTERHIHSMLLQDEYRPSERLTLTAGLRHDDYSDVGASTTPRLAAVYRLDRRHIFKAQYARAFRPPTFYELGGTIDHITPSTITTYEAGYIYKGHEDELGVTLFHSGIDDPITFSTEGTVGYSNDGDVSLHGAELEWMHRFNQRAKLHGNLSWLQSENRDAADQPLGGSSDWLGNVSVDLKPASDTRVNIHYRYVGEVHREVNDSREALSDYSTLDLTISQLDFYKPELTLRLGVKNLLDQEVRYPAPADTYPQDRPRPGRRWWAGLSYQF